MWPPATLFITPPHSCRCVSLVLRLVLPQTMTSSLKGKIVRIPASTMKFLINSIPVAALAFSSIFAIAPVSGQSAKEILASGEISESSIIPELSCGYFQMFRCARDASTLIEQVRDLKPDSSKEEILTLIRKGLTFIDDCWTCVFDDDQEAAICSALTKAVNLLEPLNIKIPVPSECKTVNTSRSIGAGVNPVRSLAAFSAPMDEKDLIAATAAALEDAGVASSTAIATATVNSATVSRMMSPMGTGAGCIPAKFSAFEGMISHEGTVCIEDVGVRVQGDLKVLGNTLLHYDEYVGAGAVEQEFCMPEIKVPSKPKPAEYKLTACIEVGKDYATFWAKQEMCYGSWFCVRTGKISETIDF